MNKTIITKDFYGTVLLKEWMRLPSGAQAICITGTISVFKDTEFVGFEAKGNESNWVLMISGKTEQITILGCQIRGVSAHSENKRLGADIYVVE